MYKIEFKIDGLPKRINQQSGKHWAFRAGENNKWRNLIACAIGYNKPAKPLTKAKLSFIRASSNAPDFDGLVQSFKGCCDALIRLGIIIDDKMTVIGKPDYNWIKAPAGKGYIIISVEEIEDLEHN